MTPPFPEGFGRVIPETQSGLYTGPDWLTEELIR
jgi:hypothetical protein